MLAGWPSNFELAADSNPSSEILDLGQWQVIIYNVFDGIVMSAFSIAVAVFLLGPSSLITH